MKKKILLIEDEPDLVELLEMRLAGNGFDVETARNGLDGFNKAVETKPDLIILDVVMPVMDGYEVCMKLKDDPGTKSIPVIVLTATGEKDVARRVKRFGADDCILKPHDTEELLGSINSLLGS